MPPYVFLAVPVALIAASLVALAGLSHSVFSGWSYPVRYIQQAMGQSYRNIYREEDRTRLIKFSHAYHATEVGAECSQCHTSAQTSEASGDNLLARMDQCYTCHDQKTTDCQYCHVEAAEPYSAFASPKRELVFSHKQHIVDQQMKCEACHAGVEKKAYENISVLPVMDNCVSCHNGVKADNECRVCHTDIRFIRPDDHTADFMLTHKQIVAASSSTNCVFCHAEESCVECHQGSRDLRTVKKKDFIGSMGNRLGGDQVMVLESAHALDYLFTHRFDAKARTSECQSCHESQTFCGTCHAEGSKTMRPAWHDVAGFTSGPAPTLHSRLAKKDMENCASCHQVEGFDVTCVRCHNPDGTLK